MVEIKAIPLYKFSDCINPMHFLTMCKTHLTLENDHFKVVTQCNRFFSLSKKIAIRIGTFFKWYYKMAQRIEDKIYSFFYNENFDEKS